MTQLKETSEGAKAPPSTSASMPTSTPVADSGSPSGAPRSAPATAEPKGLCAALASDGGEEAALVEQIGDLTVTRTKRTVPGDRTYIFCRVSRNEEASRPQGATGSKKIYSESGSAAKHDEDGDKQDRVVFEDDKFLPAQPW
ncbi:hypothetical protein VTO73DRAFT_4568 [Trametes versicolor]